MAILGAGWGGGVEAGGSNVVQNELAVHYCISEIVASYDIHSMAQLHRIELISILNYDLFYLPVCKPDLKLNFDNGIRDVSGNNYRVVARRVRLYNGAAYFRGNSKLLVEPFRPKANDDGTFIVKLRYREDLRRRRMWGLQSLVTNGHCGRDASVVITKVPGKVFVGAEASNMTKYFYLPTTVSIRVC